MPASIFKRADQKLIFQLCVSIWVSIANGAQFCFGIFTPFMKGYGKFAYTQKEVTTVATVGAVLSFCSLPTGYLYDRYGPKPTLIIGSVLNLLGWLGMYLLFVNKDDPILGTSPAWMCFFYGFSQLSASFYETGSVLTNLEAFSSQQGRIIIIQKTFMGLGSSVITTYYMAFFHQTHDISKFCMFLALFNFVTGIYGAFVVKLPDATLRVRGLNGIVGGKPVAAAAVAESTGDFAQPEKKATPPNSVDSNLGCESSAETTNELAGPDTQERFEAMRKSVPMDVEEEDAEVQSHIHLLEEQKHGQRYDHSFYCGFVVLFLCMVFLTATAIVEDYVDVSQSVLTSFGFIITGLVLSFFVMLMLVPNKSGPCSDSDGIFEPLVGGGSGAKDGEASEHTTVSTTTGGAREADLYDEGRAEDDPLHSPATPPNRLLRRSLDHKHHYQHHISFQVNTHSMPENMKHIEMWLLWFVSFCVWGAGIIVSNNSAQIYRALDFERYSERVNTVFVSIFGVASALGRIIVGAVDPYLKAKGYHISVLFPVAPIMNVLGMPLFLIIPPDGLIVPFFIAGLSTGVSWGSTVLMVKTLFSKETVGKHYNVLYTAGMLCPIVFSIGLFASVYDYHSDQQGRQEDHSCKGTECVMWPLLVPTILNGVAIWAAYAFYKRIRDKGGFVY